MVRNRVIVAVLGITLLLGACGGSSDGSGSSAPTAPVATANAGSASAPSQVGSIGDAVEVAAGAPGAATGAVCDLDRSMLTAASEMYLALNGTAPTSQMDLVDAELIEELSPRFEITAEGELVPAPGSPCT